MPGRGSTYKASLAAAHANAKARSRMFWAESVMPQQVHNSGRASRVRIQAWIRDIGVATLQKQPGASRVCILHFAFCILHYCNQGRAGSISTAIVRHFCCLKRATLSTHRVKWPSTIAIQISPDVSGRHISIIVQSPSGTAICEMIEM